jgi:hypothetical protein
LSLWYKPNSVLVHVAITNQISQIGTTPVQFATTGTVLIPANRRIIVTCKIYCDFLNNGGYLQALMDGTPNADGPLAEVYQATSFLMFGQSVFLPSSGGHVFSMNCAALSNVMNIRGDYYPGAMEVRDWGAV